METCTGPSAKSSEGRRVHLCPARLRKRDVRRLQAGPPEARERRGAYDGSWTTLTDGPVPVDGLSGDDAKIIRKCRLLILVCPWDIFCFLFFAEGMVLGSRMYFGGPLTLVCRPRRRNLKSNCAKTPLPHTHLDSCACTASPRTARARRVNVVFHQNFSVVAGTQKLVRTTRRYLID